jgi:beta-phosphoglucomutase
MVGDVDGQQSSPEAAPGGLVPVPRAVIFDFNGTISDDEPLLARIFVETFAEVGIQVSVQMYFAEYAGYSDPEIIERVLRRFGRFESDLMGELLSRRSAIYVERATVEPTVRPAAAEFVRQASRRVPVAIASGAAGAEIDAVLRAAGLRELFDVIVAAEHVTRGKPDPQGYLFALGMLNESLPTPLMPGDVLVFEDSVLGVQAAVSAGMRCVAVTGTADPGDLGLADAVVSALDWSIPIVEGWG